MTPNLDCRVYKKGEADLYGQPQLGRAIAERCAVVKLKHDSQHTTVRADSGASRGHADEFVATSKILLMPTTTAELDDKLEVHGIAMRVISKWPRFDVAGRLDHYEVQGELWE